MRQDKVLIAGGGVAALEAMLALRSLLGDRVEIELYAPGKDFVYRPFAVAEPFGMAEVTRFDIADLAGRCDARLVRTAVTGVFAGQRRIVDRNHEEVPYDHLVLATGAEMLWPMDGAATFWGTGEDGRVGDVLGNVSAGRVRKLVFTMPPGFSWPLPLYELALLTAARMRSAGIEGVQLSIVTPEQQPLELLGAEASERVAAVLEQRGIELLCGRSPLGFESGLLSTAPVGQVDADDVISMPKLEGRRLPGVPSDRDGYVPVDAHARVNGLKRVYAAGDTTDCAVKQGGLATQQADAAAEQIAAELGYVSDPAPFEPVLRGALVTDDDPHRPDGSEPGDHALWWPPGKITGMHLAPFLSKIAGRDLQPPEPQPPCWSTSPA